MFIKEIRKSIRRNPLITRTLYYSKDMESFATGLKRIQDACDEAGCMVEYYGDEYGFTVRFYRHCGYVTECLNYVKEIAISENCYKMMLLTGAKDAETLNFYRKAGYNSADKTAFIQWID